MTKLIYRGHDVKDASQVRQTLADQMRKPHLVYRGVAHDGNTSGCVRFALQLVRQLDRMLMQVRGPTMASLL